MIGFDSILKNIVNDQTICYYHAFQDNSRWLSGSAPAGFNLKDFSGRNNNLTKSNIDDDSFHLTNISGWRFDGVDDFTSINSANILTSGQYASFYFDFEFYTTITNINTFLRYYIQGNPAGFYWIQFTTSHIINLQYYSGGIKIFPCTNVLTPGRYKILILIDTLADEENIISYVNNTFYNSVNDSGIVKPSNGRYMSVGGYGSLYCFNGLLREFLWTNDYLLDKKDYLFNSSPANRT